MRSNFKINYFKDRILFPTASKGERYFLKSSEKLSEKRNLPRMYILIVVIANGYIRLLELNIAENLTEAFFISSGWYSHKYNNLNE